MTGGVKSRTVVWGQQRLGETNTPEKAGLDTSALSVARLSRFPSESDAAVVMARSRVGVGPVTNA